MSSSAAPTPVRTPNLPLSTTGVPREVLVHTGEPDGPFSIERMKIEYLVQRLVGLAGLDETGVADLSLRLTAETAARKAGDAPVTLGGNRVMIGDRGGGLGVQNAVYVPRNIAFRQGATEFNGPVGPESTALAGYVQFGPVNPAVVSSLYLDLDASPVLQLATYPAWPPADRPDRVRLLAVLYDGQIATTLPVTYYDGKPGEATRLAPTGPIATDYNPADGRLLLIPKLFVRVADANRFELFTPPTGQSHWVTFVDPAIAVDARYYFDLRAARAGGDPIKVFKANDGSQFGGPYMLPLGTSMGGVFSPAAGLTLARTVPNQCLVTRNAAASRYLFTGSAIDSITDPTLTGLGFLKGARNSSGGNPYYGDLITGTAPFMTVFVRFYAQTNVAGDFGDGRAFLNVNGNPVAAVSVSGGTASEEFRRPGSTATSFIARIEVPLGAPSQLELMVGCENTNGRDIRITGLQWALSRDPAIWIARNDFGGAATMSSALARLPTFLSAADPDELVIGPDLFMVQGEELPLRFNNCLPERAEGFAQKAIFTSLPNAIAEDVYNQSGTDGEILLRADRLWQTGKLRLRRRAYPIDLFAEAGCNCWVSPAFGYTQTIRILLIGDSLTNRRIAAFLDLKLRKMGITPIFLGTMNGAGAGESDWNNSAGGPLGEAREGWGFEDFIYQNTRFSPIGQSGQSTVAQYSAGTKVDRLLRNPLVFPAAPGPNVYNGYKIDVGQYLTRFGFAVPDFVVVSLVQNDEYGTPAAALQRIQNGLAAMIPSIRAAGANTQIGVAVHTRQRTLSADAQYPNYRHPDIKALVAYVRALNDAKVKVLPLWQHMDENLSSTNAVDIAANAVGTARTYVADDVHFDDPMRHLVAQVYRNWIAWGLSGGTAYGPNYLIEG